MSRKALTATVVAATIAWSIGFSALVAPLTASAAAAPGSLVKASLPAVYYVGSDGKRYVFPNEKTYKTWYSDFSTVMTITDGELASLVIGGNVTYRPGVKMVKITTDPKVYAVDANGTLRWVKSEALAVSLYGSDWNTVDTQDVSDAFFTNYHIGSDVNSTSDYSPATATSTASSINTDKGLGAVAGSISVSLASDNPAGGQIISDGTAGVAGSQGKVTVLKVVFTGSGTVDTLRLKRLGVSADSDVDNVFLYDDAGLVAEMTSLSSGVVTFTNSSGLFTVNGSKTIWVKFDLNRDSTGGKSIGFGITASSDIVLDGGSFGGGNFPLNGNLKTVTGVSDFGRVQLGGLTNSSTVDPGTNNFEAMRFTLAATNQDAKLLKIRLKALGSIDAADLADFKLYDAGTQVGSTVAALDGNKYVTFDLSATPYTLTNGVTKTFSVKVNVKGGSTRTVQLSFQRSYDLEAWDANYNVGIVPDTGTIGTFAVTNSTAATVASGSLTVTLSTTSPTGNVALNATNLLLAKYDLKAVGEGIKVSSLGVVVSDEGDAAGPADGASNWTNIRNVRVLYNGSQVGTTQTSLADDTLATVTVNFTVAAGTTGTLEVRADVASASGAVDAIIATDNVRAYLDTGSGNGQRVNSLGTINVPSADTAGSNLTVAAATLTPVVNPSVGNVTLVQSQTNVRIGSWLLTPEGDTIDLSSLVFVDRNNAGTGAGTQSLGASFTNLTLKSGGSAIASTVVPNTTDAVGTTYTFNLTNTMSLASATVVDLYADVLSNANSTWTDTERARIASFTATGKTTGTTVTSAVANGQAITVTTAGTISLAPDASSPVATQQVMGATEKTLGVFKFSADNTEDLTVTQIIVTNENAAGSGEFKNIKLFVDGVQVGATAPAFNGDNVVGFGDFSILVPRAGEKLVTVKGDVTSFSDGATASDFVTLSFDLPATITGVSSDTVIAKGASSNQYALAASTDADAASQYAYRTTLTASLACSGSCSGRTRASSDIVGKLTLTGTSTTSAQLRPALQYNDDTDEAGTGNNWETVNGTTANAVAADTAVSVDGASISWTATTDFEVDDLLIGDLPATADLSGYSRVSFWLYSTEALTSSDDLAFMVNDSADTTTTSQRTLGAFAATTWTYVDIAMPTSRAVVAADDFFGLRALSTGELTTTAVKIDEVRFYNDSINVDVSGNLCDTDANCVSEDGGTVNTPTGVQLLLKNAGGTTVGVGYYTGTATTGTATLFLGADVGAPTGTQTATTLTPAAGLLSLGGTAQTFDLVADTSQLVDSDSTATEVLSLSMDLGTSATAGDFRWWDQGVTATSPITWMNGTSPISVSLGY